MGSPGARSLGHPPARVVDATVGPQDGEAQVPGLGRQRQWRRPSRRDLATLVLAVTLGGTAVLPC